MARGKRPAATPGVRYAFDDEAVVSILNAKKANPQKIGEELAAIAVAAGGHLTPQAAVEAARDPRSALHDHFEWDDTRAADAYRIDQARRIIRLVVVVDNDRVRSPPAFLSISEGNRGTSYRQIGEVLGSVGLQDAVLKAAERDLLAFERRYQRLEDICDIVRAAREKIAERRAGKHPQPEARS